MKQIELCARNVSAAIREAMNAVNAISDIDFAGSAKEDGAEIRRLLSGSVNALETAQAILSRCHRK